MGCNGSLSLIWQKASGDAYIFSQQIANRKPLSFGNGKIIKLYWESNIECFFWFNQESKDTIITITWNRMQFKNFLSWRIKGSATRSLLPHHPGPWLWVCGDEIKIIFCVHFFIGGSSHLECHNLFWFNQESKDTIVTITWNRMQFKYFLNWRSINWSGTRLSLLNQFWNFINYMEYDAQLMDIPNWWINWSGMALSLSIQIANQGHSGNK